MYRDALPYYLAAGDATSAGSMYTNLPLNTADDKLFAWEAGLAISLYGNGDTWFGLDTASIDSMQRVV